MFFADLGDNECLSIADQMKVQKKIEDNKKQAARAEAQRKREEREEKKRLREERKKKKQQLSDFDSDESSSDSESSKSEEKSGTGSTGSLADGVDTARKRSREKKAKELDDFGIKTANEVHTDSPLKR